MSKTFNVTMLDVLREPFQEWLSGRGLVLAHVPDSAEDSFIVIPADFLFGAPPPEDRR